ncbi:hypothetical protein D3C86_1324630 [compost metagenome]
MTVDHVPLGVTHLDGQRHRRQVEVLAPLRAAQDGLVKHVLGRAVDGPVREELGAVLLAAAVIVGLGVRPGPRVRAEQHEGLGAVERALDEAPGIGRGAPAHAAIVEGLHRHPGKRLLGHEIDGIDQDLVGRTLGDQ